MDTKMSIFVLQALLGMLCLLVQSAQSVALATPTEQPCSPGQFFNAEMSMCDHCAVLPEKPSEQEKLHYQRRCLSHPVCCPASVPGETPPQSNATSLSTGTEPHGGLATTLSPSSAAAEPDAGCSSSLPAGAIVAIAVLALLVIALAGTVALLWMRLRKKDRQNQNKKALSTGGEVPLLLHQQPGVQAAAAPPEGNPGPTVTNPPARGDNTSTYYATVGQG